MIDHQIGGDERIGAFGIGAHCAERIPHGRQIDNAGNAGEILQQHAGRAEVDFFRLGADFPFRDVLDIGCLDGGAVFSAQQVFDQNLDGIGNAGDVRAALFQGFERDSSGTGCLRRLGWKPHQSYSIVAFTFIVDAEGMAGG